MFCGHLSAQQLGVLSLQDADPYLYNTAAAGLDNDLKLSSVYRKQWAGLQNSPSTFLIGGHGVFQTSSLTNIFEKQRLKGQVTEKDMFKYHDERQHVLKHALGGKIAVDKFGAYEHTQFSGSYAIHLPMNNFSVALGSAIGISNYKLDPERVTLLEGNDQTYDSYLSGAGSSTFLNTDLSILIYTKKFYVGYSSNQFLPNAMVLSDNGLQLQLNTHHYFTAGYQYAINEKMKVSSGLIVGSYNGLPNTIQFSANGKYMQRYEFGMGYRAGDAIIMKLGYTHMNKITFKYAYDLNITGLNQFNSGSHELLFSYTIF